jgi:hypothetical protein
MDFYKDQYLHPERLQGKDIDPYNGSPFGLVMEREVCLPFFFFYEILGINRELSFKVK